MKNLTVISGGQTGVDQAALRAAKACGIPTGGYAPKGWHTEAGPCPWLADEFGLTALAYGSYPDRTRANVQDADALLWLGSPSTPGGRLTVGLAEERRLPRLVYDLDRFDADELATILDADIYRLMHAKGGTLFVAGNRESKSPGIGAKAEAVLTATFRLLCPEGGAA